MDTKILNDVYRDFFGDSLVERDKETEEQVKEETEETLTDVDNLFIDDKSKELLKKIINYIMLYSEKK